MKNNLRQEFEANKVLPGFDYFRDVDGPGIPLFDELGRSPNAVLQAELVDLEPHIALGRIERVARSSTRSVT